VRRLLKSTQPHASAHVSYFLLLVARGEVARLLEGVFAGVFALEGVFEPVLDGVFERSFAGVLDRLLEGVLARLFDGVCAQGEHQCHNNSSDMSRRSPRTAPATAFGQGEGLAERSGR